MSFSFLKQIYLFILAVETGVQLAIFTKRFGNGKFAVVGPLIDDLLLLIS